MIHQIIFAAPKPGMSDDEFQRYWVEEHAVKYASKIPQIRKYLIDTTIPFENTYDLPYRGVAEIWLKNDEESLASLQTPEFLKGARADEPNWAAFWLTFGLDTDAHVVIEGPSLSDTPKLVKLIITAKRKPGMTVDAFRNYGKMVHGPLVSQLPGLRRYMQCYARDGHYAYGEARFDAVWQLWFDDVESISKALKSDVYLQQIQPDLDNFTDSKYNFSFVGKEHWIIGPEPR